MKLFVKIIKAVLTIVLALVVIGLATVCILSSTILNEGYILKELQSSNYYSNIYNEVQSNFENYIGPSGLDENILTDICTVEDIEKDTEIILGNIYEGTNKSIDVNSMKENIVNKINASLDDTKTTSSMRESVEQFAEAISVEYKNTISHTEYEQMINDMYSKAVKIMNFAKLAICVCIVAIAILLILINLKTLHRTLDYFGIAMASAGVFCVIANLIVNGNVRVQNIRILNSPISTSVQNIIADILSQFISVGLVLAGVGVILIIISNVIQEKNTEE